MCLNVYVTESEGIGLNLIFHGKKRLEGESFTVTMGQVKDRYLSMAISCESQIRI